MKKLIWKFKYARYMVRKANVPWLFAWYSAGIQIDNEPYWADWKPEDLCYEEMCCWNE